MPETKKERPGGQIALYEVRLRALHALAVCMTEGSYGHQVEDVVTGALLGRKLKVPVALMPPRKPANSVLHRLTSRDVRFLVGKSKCLVRGVVAEAQEGCRAAPEVTSVTPGELGVDMRSELASVSLTFRLPGLLQTGARIAARRMGINPSRPIACLHARDPGFFQGSAAMSADDVRNADIATYGQTADLLADAGFTVVRIGDARSVPFPHPRVIDLAASPARSDALETFVCLSANLFVTGDSGASRSALLASAPLLTVNALNLMGAYPLRTGDRILPKRVFDAQTGAELSLEEMLKPRKEPSRWRIIDNTPEEIAEAVREMLGVLRGDDAHEQHQERFHMLAQAVWSHPKHAARRELKGFTRDALLGKGVVSRAAARERLRD
jgi:putative glycosyltransferase (TIGR04372 family)